MTKSETSSLDFFVSHQLPVTINLITPPFPPLPPLPCLSLTFNCFLLLLDLFPRLIFIFLVLCFQNSSPRPTAEKKCMEIGVDVWYQISRPIILWAFWSWARQIRKLNDNLDQHCDPIADSSSRRCFIW